MMISTVFHDLTKVTCSNQSNMDSIWIVLIIHKGHGDHIFQQLHHKEYGKVFLQDGRNTIFDVPGLRHRHLFDGTDML